MKLTNRLLMPVALALLLLGSANTANAQRGRRGKLDIKTNPSARVYMKGQLKGTTPIKLNAPPGRHTIVFKARGYNDLRASVNVRPGRVTKVFRKLVPKAPPTGKISIRSQPPARVFLGGKPIGRTPILNRSFPRGRHTVKLVTNDGREWATTIHIRKGFPAKINHRFRPRHARLKINTNPPARVLLNGRMIGTTPLAQEKIKPGRHKIILRARGYHTETVTFVARPGELKTITRKLRPRVPPTGKISVRSQPPARVFLGGKPIGRTPVLNHTFPRGRHPLKLVTKRGREWTTTVEIKHGAPVKINHRFPPLHARLRVNSNPIAKAFLNGRPIGKTPVDMGKLPPGKHTIELRARGYHTETVTFVARPGELKTITRKLRPRVPPTGKISVRSQPPARVFLGGKPIGRTPVLNHTFPRGRHPLKLVTKRGREWTTTVEIKHGAPVKINHRFPPLHARLRVNSNPTARVLLNGRNIGKTPVSMGKLPPGKHTIELRARGHHPDTVTFVARPGELKNIVRKLRPKRRKRRMGWIHATSSPRARVFLNGKFMGVTPMAKIEAPPGVHKIRFEPRKGRKGTIERRTVRVEPGRGTRVNVTLKRRRRGR